MNSLRRTDLTAILDVLPRKCVACKQPGDANCEGGMLNFCGQCEMDFGGHVNELLLHAQTSNNDLVDVEKLICLVVSKPKGHSLTFAFHLLQKLDSSEAKILLPEIAFMRKRLECCHDMIVRSRLQSTNLVKNHYDWEEGHGTISLVNVPIHSIMVDDLLCHDKIMILNLLMVKLVFKQRCESLQSLSKSWEDSVSGTTIEKIGEFLGAHSKWKIISSPLLEKQCMDLVKLLFLIDPRFVPALIRTCQSSRVRSILRTTSTSSIRALRHLLVFWRLMKNDFIIKFIKEVAADIPQ